MSDDAVVLGKRKQREGDEQGPTGSTLFVSNLPYNATSTDLKTLFSDFAPVRSAFVVLENNVSKGVGYVSFAIKEDAKTTLQTIEKDGLRLNGRTLRVQMADRKSKDKSPEMKVKGEGKTPTVPRIIHAKVPKDPNAIRTIVISGLPESADKKVLWKKIRKYEGAESVELVEGEPGVAHVLFSSPATAVRAVEKLHAHIFKGAILSVTLKKRLESLAKVPGKKDGNGTETASAAAPSRASRLIVRNLPWDISERDLRALFLPFGPIYSVNIPMVEISPASEDPKTGKQSKPRAKGFAFVWFFSKKDAERAIAGVNGRTVEAGAIVAPTLNKKERQRLRRLLREKKIAEGEEDDGGENNDSDAESLDGKSEVSSKARGSRARILAVDWALSKDKWEEAKAKTLNEQDGDSGADASESDEEPDAGSVDEEESNANSESDEMKSGNEMSVDNADEDEGVRSDAEEVGKPSLPQTDVGTTVFVRNLPFDATEDELRILFRTFGPLRYARITMDPETGRSRGTGFVCFWNREDADKAIHQSELLNREAGAGNAIAPAKKSNPFSLPSLLTPDPSSSLAQSLVLHGRTLDVTRAVTREEAAKLKDEGERQREKADKRNLYLLREGVIFPGTPAAATLHATELEKRQASFNARRNLLKSNPLLYVSKTRLSIRQLPLFVSERALKRLGIHAVRAFEQEVKRGEREPLSADELRAEHQDAVHVDNEAGGSKTEKRRKTKKGERETGVKQAKVVREAGRVDGLTGKGRSRGYGFLEMKRHGDAMRVLRWANNNRALGALFEDWWKSEVEDTIKVLEGQSLETDAEKETTDARLRLQRLKTELERLRSGERHKKGGKTLIVEFSIENAQVVNRRKEKIETTKSASKRAPRLNSTINDGDDDDREWDRDREDETTPSPPKRRKVAKTSSLRNENENENENENNAHPVVTSNRKANDGPVKLGKNKNIGRIIGRKRKLRKVRAKA